MSTLKITTLIEQCITDNIKGGIKIQKFKKKYGKVSFSFLECLFVEATCLKPGPAFSCHMYEFKPQYESFLKQI